MNGLKMGGMMAEVSRVDKTQQGTHQKDTMATRSLPRPCLSLPSTIPSVETELQNRFFMNKFSLF